MDKSEEYTMMTEGHTKKYRCPCPIQGNSTYEPMVSCSGSRCAAWVWEVDDNGERTGRGRCGMVGLIREICVTCV